MINILDDSTINKIAAGEVVEGPYSIVKELIENSIDAEATSITVEIKEGGKKYIRVTDNGSGIEEKEVEKAFLRHATSKISKIKDLYKVLSLGFRGEALASITSVAQVEMITKTRDQQYGISIEVNGGKVISKKPIGCPNGTTIIVKNLFFNTPARLKFMKSTQGETAKITEIITRLALSKPNVAFKYINNNNIMFTTLGDGNLSSTIYSILQDDWVKNMIEVNKKANNLTMEGFIGQPTLYRGNRSYEIIYVNGRYVKSKLVSQAIELAYKENLPINKYPVCVLNIRIDPSLIDVNVHPMKTEVKIKDEADIFKCISTSLKEALIEEITIPMLKVKEAPTNQLPNGIKECKNEYNTKCNMDLKQEINNNINGIVADTDYTPEAQGNVDLVFKSILKNENKPIDHQNKVDLEEPQENFLVSIINNNKIIGQLFNTYILIEKESSLYIIDQHAAHERLVYNRLKEEHKQDKVVSQQLLEPKVLNLSIEDYTLMISYLERFNNLGFDIEEFGQNTIIIRSVPMVMGIPQSFDFIYQLIDDLKETTDKELFQERVIKRACKEAIKANDRLNTYEISELLNDLSRLVPPLTCPHGRPILTKLTKYEIEKYFKRIQ
ncbi:DNA mismatch repair endonuclease MutL [Alkaliphilus pronyensis]|nr:DNA mismatch repair endonuclease MutL [Alkaliphilus pronyensis]